jgi:hypothetical protein
MAEFFFPGAEPQDAEERYVTIAGRVHRTPADPGQRIEKIVFVHDGGVWTAQVGHRLRGTRERQRTRGGHKVTVTNQLSDPSTVLAIFEGIPYLVVTDKGLSGVRSAWENPFFAGQPESVRFFDLPTS